MASIKRKGIPDKNTKGSVGDFYIDLNTGSKYECTSSYSYSALGSTHSEYEWKLISVGAVKENPQPQPQSVETETKHSSNPPKYVNYSKSGKKRQQ